MKRVFIGLSSVLLLAAFTLPAGAQEPIVVPGEVVVVPIVTDPPIVLDGDLGDWATLPAVTTNDGPTPSADPANSGQMRWQVAADASTLFFAATITDDNIVAGQNGDDFWNEDSIELYVNVSGDDTLTSYGDGVAQITFSAVDRGNIDPEQLTLSGSGAPNFSVRGFVFATTAGWGVEVAVDLTGKVDPVSGESIGFQVQANGSSGGDRDLKISWSAADIGDTSYQDPSVFGRAVFFDESAAVAVEAPVDEEPVVADDLVAESSEDVADPPSVDESTVDVAVVEEPGAEETESGRAFLYAAIVSAVSILIGGLWFERRRKKSEAQAAAAAAGDVEENVDDLIASILDDQSET